MYFIRPVTLYWTFQQVTKINILDSFQALPPSSPANNNPTNTNINQQIIKNINDDIELISDDDNTDDEITVNQCIKITINNDILYEEISNDDNELNKALSLNNNESLYEAISDDDNAPNPALPPNDNDLYVSNHDMVDDVSGYEQQQQQSLTKKRQLHSRARSSEARKRRNRKRNLYFRMQRYRYFITRSFYYRFTM
ncbi:unnamed protein product, partial [Rotaria sordida]